MYVNWHYKRSFKPTLCTIWRIEKKKIKTPKALNFAANEYFNIIDWDKETIKIPPILFNVANTDLLKVRDGPFQIPTFPCHSQGVERGITLVTAEAQQRIGYEIDINLF
jgi:hypothetical protein